MEIIKIDSSDDEDDVPTSARATCRLAAKRRIGIGLPAASASRNANDVTQSQSARSSDDGSVSSSSDSLVREAKNAPSKTIRLRTPSEGDVSTDEDSVDSDDELEIVGLPPAPPSNSKPKPDDAEVVAATPARELPPEAPLPVGATWRVVLLMDHREFGNSTDFLRETQRKINRHFGGTYADIESLPSADYMFVARLVSDSNSEEVLDERVLDTVIERKCVVDLAQCLTHKSKMYRPLTFFDAQMYKFRQNGIPEKIFVMEGDEDLKSNVFAGAHSRMEKMIRLKRIKTTRLQLERGEWAGVDLVCTRNKRDTIDFLIRKLEEFRRSFDPRRPPAKNMRKLKAHIDAQMNMPTFQEYLRLRRIGGIGVVKAMKAILDPKSDWDKSFVSPEGTSRPSKSTLEDRATFWPDRVVENPNAASSSKKNPEIVRMAAAIAKCQKAVIEFDNSAEGKERMKLDGKRKNSKTEMTRQDSSDLDELNRRRASLAQARKTAKSEGGDDDAVASATKALADFDAWENGGKKRSRLMQKRRHSLLVLSDDELARLERLTERRDALSDVKRHSRPSVAERRRALREFDESAEGRERRALDERSKNSKKKMTEREAAELAELNGRRNSLSRARKEAKLRGGAGFVAADENLVDFDKSKQGRNRFNLMSKRRFSQMQMSCEEVAKLRALNKKREVLTSKINHSLSTSAPCTNEWLASESNATRQSEGAASAAASNNLGKRSYGNRKEPPERLIKRQKIDKQLSNSASTADTSDDEEALCGICFKSIDIWVDKNIVLCNRVAACGATFHQSCLTAREYDIRTHDGCIQCQPKSKFTTKNESGTGKSGLEDSRFSKQSRQDDAGVIVLDSDDDHDKDDDDVIVID